jgi:hypothetical protein
MAAAPMREKITGSAARSPSSWVSRPRSVCTSGFCEVRLSRPETVGRQASRIRPHEPMIESMLPASICRASGTIVQNALGFRSSRLHALSSMTNGP